MKKNKKKKNSNIHLNIFLKHPVKLDVFFVQIFESLPFFDLPNNFYTFTYVEYAQRK